MASTAITHRLPERLLGAGAEPAQDGLDLGERLLDRREVGRVGRQEEQLAVARFKAWRMLAALWTLKLSSTTTCPGRSVGASCSVMYHSKVVGIHGPLDHPGLVQPVGGERRHQRRVLAVVARHGAGRALVMRRPAVEAGQGDVRATFVDKDELLGVELGDRFAPGGARLLVALAGCQCLFLCVQPSRRIARHMVASLSCWPCCSAHQAQCSSTVASGAASSRARNAASCSRSNAPRTAGNGLALQRAGLALLHHRAFDRGHGDAKAASGFSHGLTLSHRSHQAFFQVGRIGTHTGPLHNPCLPLLLASCSNPACGAW